MDGRDLTLLRLYGAVRVEIVLWIVAGFAQTFDMVRVVGAVHIAHHGRRPHHGRRRTHSGRRVHCLVMMSPMMRRQSARASESNDSDRQNAFSHRQFL